MAKNDLNIDILGTAITISTDEDPVYLDSLLNKYRQTIENVKQISGLKDPLKLAVLTGFLLCDDLEKAGSMGEKTEPGSGEEPSEVERLTLGLISRLDEALTAGETAKETASDPDRQAENKAIVPDAKFYRLQNIVKNYEWGSPEWIPALIGRKNLSRIPWAELWMGVNPAAPSSVILSEYGTIPETLLLSELVNRKKTFFLGEETSQYYGTIPFLFKVLAAAKPLSIQAHPNMEQAREGYERENREGIPLDAPNRNYRNPSHKPEIICALGPFASLCGFRKATEIIFLLEILSQESEGALKAGFEDLLSALKQENDNPYRAFLSALFNLGNGAYNALGPFIKTQTPLLERDFPEYRDEWKLCSYFTGLSHREPPGSNDPSGSNDPGILAPLYLNIIELAPGEAMYLPAGVFHSYIHGMGMELMADSDNVLRGGLTSKYMDKEELLRILDFSEYIPEILKIPDPAPSWFSYPAPAEEFALSVMHCEGDTLPYPEKGPSIVFISEGSLRLTLPGSGTETEFYRGESFFIPAGQMETLKFSGTFVAYTASVGKKKDENIPAGPKY